MRDALIFHIVSGESFFSGVALIGLALVLTQCRPNGWVRVGRTCAELAGLGLIVTSASPLRGWFYALAGVLTVAWIGVEGTARPSLQRVQPGLRMGVLAVWLLGVALEVPYHRMPRVPAVGERSVYVVADSLAAGMGDATATWPRLLAREHRVLVHDLSVAGATVASAVRNQGPRVSEPGALVLVEIGGNDVLVGTPPAAFEGSLDALLGRLRANGRMVIMLELPLPPFYNSYGAIQRRLARRHGARLLPKRILLGVLTTPGATVDTVHLSRQGHERMARVLGGILWPDALDGKDLR